MDQHTVTHVQSSWKALAPNATDAGKMFYANLFEADPSLSALFKGDMQKQAESLMTMIGVAVGKLNDLDALVPVLQDLAIRHKGYGVEPAHYETVGAALLKTLEQAMGDGFTPDLKQAWADVYNTMASVMVEAAG